MSASEDTAPPKGESPGAEPEVKAPESSTNPSPVVPESPSTPKGFTPLVTVVGFHHARGPEVESWFGVDEGEDPAATHGWSLLPFMALSDGAHASEEDFSYFTLLRPKSETEPATSLFGISCTRQMDASKLIERPADVTRSTVQKAVVVIADNPQSFGMLRERLSIVTQAWFAQRDFVDTEILRRFQESLAEEHARGAMSEEPQRDQYLGMSLREIIHEFKWQALVLLKCCLLQPKMLFFGSRCDRLCMVQFSLLSLIPGLIRNLQDCADPELDSYKKKLSQPSSLQSSNRNSLLSFMGLPLQIFGKGSFFGPYTPLQQLDVMADAGTKSYIVGSTNSLLLQQKDRYSDILINLDEDTVTISSASLKAALALTAADRRWIDFLTQEVSETWDEANPSRPKNMQYVGSEEFIRSQFEAYMLGLISSVKFHNYLVAQGDDTSTLTSEADPAIDFGLEWVDAWTKTENYRMWDAHTDSNLFAVSEPKHPMAGGLTIDDVQRRIAEQLKDLHLDERFAQGRDMLGRNFAAGREKASTMFNKLYSDMEYLRETQRRRAEEGGGGQGQGQRQAQGQGQGQPGMQVDLAKAQQTMHNVGAKASAYVSSWAAWAGEKRKTGGWGSGWGKKDKSAPQSPAAPSSPIDRDYQMVSKPLSRETSTVEHGDAARPSTHASFSESILSEADAEDEGEDGEVVEKPKPAPKDDGFKKEQVVGSSRTLESDDKQEAKGIKGQDTN